MSNQPQFKSDVQLELEMLVNSLESASDTIITHLKEKMPDEEEKLQSAKEIDERIVKFAEYIRGW